MLMTMGFSFGDDENALKLIVVMAAPLCEDTKPRQVVYSKWVNCVVWEFYLNEAEIQIKRRRNVEDESVNSGTGS